MLELVDRVILRFTDYYHKRSSRFSDKGDIVVIGKTSNLHLEILGSNPNISIHTNNQFYCCSLRSKSIIYYINFIKI